MIWAAFLILANIALVGWNGYLVLTHPNLLSATALVINGAALGYALRAAIS